MNKKIITLFFIIISTASHGMEKICDDQETSEILMCVNKHLGSAKITDKTRDEKYPCLKNILDAVGKDIALFSNNHSFDEKTAQKIIRCIASYGIDNEAYISHYLGKYNNHFITVRDKIQKFNKIAFNPNQQFSGEDLSDDWYVNATQSPESNTPLFGAYFIFQPDKIEILLNAKANARYHKNNKILNSIARNRSKSPSPQTSPLNVQKLTRYLTIAQLLLEHGADPDFRLNNDPTPLMIAVCGNDKPYAHLLLWHNANPYKTGIWINNSIKNSIEIEKERDNCCEKNAFEMEPAGWLQHMVNERKNVLSNCLLFTCYGNQEECIFPKELTQFITHTAWQLGKTYNEKEKTS